MATKILVTGGGGGLGRAIKGLASREAGTWREGGAPRENGFEWLFASREELDIADSEVVAAFFEREQPDAVVNCAAYNNVDAAENRRWEAMRINAEGPRILAREAQKLGAAMVHISTDFVFGGDTERKIPYTETDPTAPVNFYGQSKLAGEQAVLDSGVSGAIVRTSWLWSPHAKGFFNTILNAATRQKEIEVVADQVGCPTSAVSLAEAIALMLPRILDERELSDNPAGNVNPRLGAGRAPMEIFHFCGREVMSRAEWARRIIASAGLDCRVIEVSSDEFSATFPAAANASAPPYASPSASAAAPTARRPKYSALDCTKFHNIYGR